METYYMIIDVALCEDCNNCFLSCKDEFVENDFLPYSAAQPRSNNRWMNIKGKERGTGSLMDVVFLPMPCMHCEDPACVKKAKNGAVIKRPDGIVLIDPIKAKGQKQLVESCPYGAIYWNEEKNVAQKCTMCAHLLDDSWKETRCAQACPTQAIQLVKSDASQMKKMIDTENLEVFHPEYGTKPRVYYKNLYKYKNCFIAGSIAYKHDKIADCAENAEVRLMKDSKKIGEALTNYLGDFKFDKLVENSGVYTLEIKYGDYKKMVNVDLKESINLGDIYV